VDPVLKDPNEIYGQTHSKSDKTSGGTQDE
jgi:hypothetical protein